MTKICVDGIDALGGLFPNEDALVEHIVEHTLFFSKEMVLQQAREIRVGIRTGEAMPVRYNSNGAFFLQHEIKTTTPRFKSKSEALKFTNNPDNYLFHRETKIRISFDSDGNYAPKCAILRNTGHRVSWGANSTVVNYTIAHIWAKTDNPLFFNSLWNYALIPTHCAFLTDKRDDAHPLIARVKELVKAISWELYNPNRIMDWNQDVITESDKPSAGMRTAARRLIAEGKINFLPKNEAPNTITEIVEEVFAAMLDEPTETTINE